VFQLLVMHRLIAENITQVH